jgi:excisionase family DNA binding protein
MPTHEKHLQAVDSPYLTPTEAAHYTRTTPRYIRKCVEDGKLTARRLGGGPRLRVLRQDVEDLLVEETAA